ncbi:hypothetical protein V5O48_008775 [Marasmius crinis-equi]|uniref:DUF6534 domain-containing protein n=1 Tax=Marasmius crinis-equi TaxID=585013 RepID=A0ABR3FDL6_9AGAR
MTSDTTAILPEDMALAIARSKTLVDSFTHPRSQLVQLYVYLSAFPRDRLFIKILFVIIFASEAAQTATLTRNLLTTRGDGAGNVIFVLDPPLNSTQPSFVIKTGIVAFLGQSFSAWRIWILSRSRVMVALVIILSLLSTVSTFVGASQMLRLGTVNLPKTITTSIWAASSALCDTTIAVCMCRILLPGTRNVTTTRNLIRRILWLTVTTGTLTALAAFTALILLLSFPRADLFVPVILLIGKVEANSYFAVLNSRIRLRSASASSMDHGAFEANLSVSPRSEREEVALASFSVRQEEDGPGEGTKSRDLEAGFTETVR